MVKNRYAPRKKRQRPRGLMVPVTVYLPRKMYGDMVKEGIKTNIPLDILIGSKMNPHSRNMMREFQDRLSKKATADANTEVFEFLKDTIKKTLGNGIHYLDLFNIAVDFAHGPTDIVLETCNLVILGEVSFDGGILMSNGLTNGDVPNAFSEIKGVRPTLKPKGKPDHKIKKLKKGVTYGG